MRFNFLSKRTEVVSNDESTKPSKLAPELELCAAVVNRHCQIPVT